MRRVVVPLSVVFVVGTLPACGGDDDDAEGEATDVFFAVESADDRAHAAMLDRADFPGAGWEVTATDALDVEEDDLAFEAAMENEPACSTINALSGLGGIFGDDDDDELPAGRAKVEFVNATLDPMPPESTASGPLVSTRAALSTPDHTAGRGGMNESRSGSDAVVPSPQ